MTLAQINRLPLATLKLQLDHYHLAHGGNKRAVARRLQHHLRTQQALNNVESHSSHSEDASPSGSDRDSSSEENTGSQESPSPSAEEDAGSGPAGEVSTGSTATPFTRAQRAALKKTVRSLMQDTGTRQRVNRTPSPPSDTERRTSRRPRSTGTRHQSRKRDRRSLATSSKHGHSLATSSKRRRRRSPSTSSSSSPSSRNSSRSSSHSSSDSDSSPHRRRKSRSHRHHQRHHHRHRHHHSKGVDIPVPRKLRHDIRRGEFVVLADLLSEHLTLSGGSSGGRKSARTRSITGLDTWLEAWSVFAGVLVSYKPELAPDLFRYQSFITRSSRRFQAYAWLQYDAQFRLKMASNPSMKWSHTDPELIATWLSADASKNKPVCFACGNPEHLSSDCPWKSSHRAPGLRCPVCNVSGHTAQHCPQLSHNKPPPADSNKPDEFCRLWNKKGSCFRGERCPYQHVCSECRGSHPKSSCSKQAR